MKKLPKGFKKRADGTLEHRFTVNGKRPSVYCKTVKEGYQKEIAVREAIEKGEYTTNNNLTLNQYFDEWIERQKGTIREKTAMDYKALYNAHVRNTIGKSKIKKIERRQIQEFREGMTKKTSKRKTKLSETTINQYMTRISHIFEEAVNDEVITKNPCKGIKPLNTAHCIQARDTIHRALTKEEAQIFLEEAKDEWLLPCFLFCLHTGLRVGEAGTLTWGDIDTENKVINITKTLSRVEGGTAVKPPKTHAGNRTIPITPKIRDILTEQRGRVMAVFGGGALKKTERIFRGELNGKVAAGSENEFIEKVLKRLKKKGVVIEYFTSHACRHTFATMFAAAQGDLKALQGILGHSSYAMTADLYAHSQEEAKQREMNKVAEAFERLECI